MRLIGFLIFWLCSQCALGQVQGENPSVFEQEIQTVVSNSLGIKLQRIEVLVRNKWRLGKHETDTLIYWPINDTVAKLQWQGKFEYYSKYKDRFYPIDSTLRQFGPDCDPYRLRLTPSDTTPTSTFEADYLDSSERTITNSNNKTVITVRYYYDEVAFVPTRKIRERKTKKVIWYNRQRQILKATIVKSERGRPGKDRHRYIMWVNYHPKISRH